MAPRKLSDSDKSDIIGLYKQPEQTSSTLAAQYGVSNSTISRILKTSLPPDEYSELISQKRMAGSDKVDATPKAKPAKKRTAKKSPAKKIINAVTEETADITDEPPSPEEETSRARPKLKKADEAANESGDESDTPKKTVTSRRRRRSRSKAEVEDEQLPLLESAIASQMADDVAEVVSAADEAASDAGETDEDDEDDLTGLDETLDDEFGDDEDDEEDEDDDDTVDLPKPKLQTTAAMSIMPLGEAVLPKPSYLVVDMRSELITRPLSDFAELGQIPSSEEKAKTLPVFDNHRVARRFSRNKQRVIKVPDGDLITRTSPYLKAKGITRLLVDGQVFDVAGRD